ncbi:MAG: SDR family oxidoreductase [Armatimonadota bacterium]
MKILVTGGAGFIGSNICDALIERGDTVVCLDNFSTGKRENIQHLLTNPQFLLIEGDIRNLDTCLQSCEGVRAVSHQAAWGSVPRSIEMPLEYEEVNIRGTLNMLEAARRQGVQRFVYASSSSVYGDSPTLPKKEGQEGRVLSPYALTKKVDEEYARLYHNLYGLHTVGLRYFNVFGRRQDPDSYYAAVIPRFVKALLSRQAPTIHGDGEQSRDFTYIDNVIQANLKAMQAPEEACGRAYNIAYGGQVTVNELYFALCRLLDVVLPSVYGPDRPGDIKHSNADVSAAREAFGYEPQIGFRQGISQALAWYKTR